MQIGVSEFFTKKSANLLRELAQEGGASTQVWEALVGMGTLATKAKDAAEARGKEPSQQWGEAQQRTAGAKWRPDLAEYQVR